MRMCSRLTRRRHTREGRFSAFYSTFLRLKSAWPCVSLETTLLLSVPLMFYLAHPSHAQQAIAAPVPGPSVFMPFDIPRQPLVTALEAYSAVTGVQVLYESSLALRSESPGITAQATHEQAIEKLLVNTGLIVRYTGQRAITISRPGPYVGTQPPASVLSAASLRLPKLHITAERPDKIALRVYSDTIRHQVEGALKRDPETRDGSYRVGVSLWVNDNREIERAEVFQSTGRQSRDLAVIAVLRRMTLGRNAPSNTPRPVKLVISVRSL